MYRNQNPIETLQIAEDTTWVVVHTRPRCEKKLGLFCLERGVPVYMPLHVNKARYGNRERIFFNPVFPGYVFCRADSGQFTLLQQNQYAARVLPVLEQETLVVQLRDLEKALELGDAVEVMPYLEAGKRVVVKSGPLKGLEGMVQRMKGKARVILNVDMIKQSVCVEVDHSHLAPL